MFIPARGGSKSIPYKNLVRVGGVSLLERAYKTALAAKHLVKHTSWRVVVSSEDKLILSTARILGAATHRRPADLATDTSHVLDTVRDFLSSGEPPDLFVFMQATSPFLRAEHISSCVNTIGEGFNCCQALVEVPNVMHFANQRSIAYRKMDFTFPRDDSISAKHAHNQAYAFGGVLVTRPVCVLDFGTLFPPPWSYITIDRISGFDLDDAQDLWLANIIAASSQGRMY